VIDSTGNTKYLHDRGSVLFDPQNKQVLLLGASDDVTRDKEQQHALLEAVRKLEYLYKTDGLTGLINRRELFEQLDEEIQRMQRTKSPSTLVYFDLDNFKQINDRYGHQVGDRALKVFAEITTSALRETDILGRVGGDEFILLLFDTGFDDSKTFLNRLAETPYHIPLDSKETVTLSMSIGKATWDESITSVQQWIELADSAMYNAKRQRQESDTVT
jgi:diguanylate cyclase (GGDEF)-like protein